MESEKNIAPAAAQTQRDTIDIATLEAARKLLSPSIMLDMGAVLGSTFGTIFKNPLFFIGLALAAILAGVPLGVLSGVLLPVSWRPFAFLLLAVVSFMVLQVAITYAVYQIKVGSRPSIPATLKRGLTRFLPAFVSVLLIFVFMLMIMLAGFLLASVTLPIVVGPLLAIPIVIVVCATIVAIPVCVVERLGAFASIRRSFRLTKGCRLKIFLLLIILGVLSGLFMVVPAIMFAMGGGVIMTTISSIVTLLVMALPMVLQTAFCAALYYELRAVKEGVSVDKMANVFD